ncbi:glutathione S-transferase [Sphingomonas sp. MAH-20]|uniref:Glutathione S-transferase n=1 Tax=Sphingomonas horti TaxID=2682842 RepID=A0A6I4J510_9SPHN|nr:MULTISPECIES: glutathione S-transferase family protein [Sphingomonas]MBA2921185.1 glutathione S-transferase family protein [Sphingomonas sp. CGMCC 1.13658]MVO79426.1 glutathione S-transferase [Sphingomonas horti]
MADQLTFYTNPMSRGRIVRWMLEEVGAPYETVLLDYASTMKAPDYLAINPMGKVPAIKHGATIVTEGAAICAYLADAFPEAGLAPPVGSKDRGPYYRWLFFAAGPLEAVTTNKAMNVEVPDERRPMVGYGTLDATADALNELVGANEYIAGGKFSAADVFVGSHIGWGTQFGTLPKRPNFDAYLARIMGRPAAVKAREIDDKAMAA